MLEAPHAIPTERELEATATGLTALLRHAAFAPLDNMGFLRVRGEDRVRWLNGMVTNSMQSLTPGEGCYNFFLSAQGRIQGDATAFVRTDEILLETQKDRILPLAELLERFIIMDDVELAPHADFSGFLVAGPEAEQVLQSFGIPTPRQLGMAQTIWNDAALTVIHAYSPVVPRFELWTDAAHADALSLAIAGNITHVSADELEQLRLLEGRPLYGVDIRDKELPQETSQTRALHFAKGCYLGQEIVERIRSRGAVHRSFGGFSLAGTVPPVGAALFLAGAPEKPIGEITSAGRVDHPDGALTLALGYIRREALEASKARGIEVLYEGGVAVPITLPYSS